MSLGENFSVNVAFTDPASTVSFNAHWTTPVPVPGSLLLLGAGLFGLGPAVWLRRR